MISGCPMAAGNTKISDIIEQKGATIVVEESCTGTRSFWDWIDENKEPWSAIAERYIKITCACMTPNEERISRIVDLARDTMSTVSCTIPCSSVMAYNIETTSGTESTEKGDRFPCSQSNQIMETLTLSRLGSESMHFWRWSHDHCRHRCRCGYNEGGPYQRHGDRRIPVTGTAFDFLTSAEKIYNEWPQRTDIDKNDGEKVYATGYGKNSISFADKGISEITAHAKGVYFLFPEVRGIIDVGGQDSKIIVVEDVMSPIFL